MKRAYALCLLLASTLTGCATWRPEALTSYQCVNTDVYFSVRYTWRPAPSARLQVEGAEPVELALTAETPGSAAGHYTYESDDGVRLGVAPGYALLTRPGERPLSCAKQEPIIV